MWLTIIQSSLCGLIHSALFIMLPSLRPCLYDNGKWKTLENEVGLLGKLSFLWLMWAWAWGGYTEERLV
jgi:hypothetical protein